MTAAHAAADDAPPLLAEIAAMRQRLAALEAAAVAARRRPFDGLVYGWIERLAGIVAGDLGVDVAQLIGDSRDPRFVRARFTWVWLVRTCGGYSYPRVARLTGYTDHTSVIHACRRIEALRARDPLVAEATDSLAAIGRMLRAERVAAPAITEGEAE